METENRKNTDKPKKTYQPENLTSLAAKYNVSLKTFRKWIKPIEHDLTIAHRKPFTPAEIKKIVDFIGDYDDLIGIS